MLQARGREMARVRLIGIWNGTLPFTMRHTQSMLPLLRVLRELQQSADGEVRLALLLVRKFIQGAKVLSIDGLHGVLTWPYTGNVNAVKAMTRTSTRREDGLENSIVLWLGQTLEELIKGVYIGEEKQIDDWMSELGV